jgi:ribosomal protein S18 acetylase RimI-like enzyme
MAPFGIRFSNVILYRTRTDRLLDQEKRSSNGLTFQVFGPDDHKAAKDLAQEHGQPIATCSKSNIVFAFQDKVPVGHVCCRSGTILLHELEREETFDDGVYLFSLFTNPSARRKGFGKQLIISAVEDALKKATHQYAYMYIRMENLASRNLAESLGFEAISITHYLRAFGLTNYQTEPPPQPLRPLKKIDAYVEASQGPTA